MKRMLLAAVLALLTLLPAACAQAEQEKKLTVMVYMCGSNLESGYGAASNDIEEMLASVPASREISLVIMTGGTEKWRYGFDPGALTISEIGSRGLRTLWQEDTASMGAPESLRLLMDVARERCPARDYALILWDHGGGPLEGLCWDELFSMDNLSLSELTQALEAAQLPKKLSWIGFDACLMSSAEVATALAPYAEYMIASQETEPASGWNYSFLSGLPDDPDGAATGRRIVDAYFEGTEQVKDTLTLACIDLSGMEGIVKGMDQFFQPIGRDLDAGSFARLSGLRMSATGFGKSVRAAGEEGYDLVDLGDLVDEYGGGTSDLEDALQSAIVYSRSNREGACGLSVYHPYANKRKYQERWHDDYQALDFSAGYLAYMERFGSLLTGGTLADWSGLTTVSAGYDRRRDHVFTLQLTDEQAASFSSAELLVLGATFTEAHTPAYVPLYVTRAELGEDGVLRAAYGGRALYLVDADGTPLKGPISFLPTSEPGRYAALAQYWDDLSLYFTTKRAFVAYIFDEPERDTENVELLTPRVYDEVSQTYTNRIALDESAFRRMGFWYDLREKPEGDDLPGFYAWERYNGFLMADLILPHAWGLRFMDDQLTNMQLYATFQVTDLQQNVYCSELIPIENPNLHPLSSAPEAVENDDMRLEVSASLNNAALMPGLDLTYTLTNRTEQSVHFDSTLLTLNGKRVTSATISQSAALAPGASTTAVVSLSGSAFEGLEEVTSLDCTIRFREEGSYDPFARLPVHLELSGLDAEALERLAGQDEPLDVVRSQVIEEGPGRFQLTAKVGVNGLDLTLRAENTGEKAYKYTFSSLMLDARETDWYWNIAEPLESGTEALRTITLERTDMALLWLEEIDQAGCTVTIQDPETYETVAKLPLLFALDGLDVHALAPTGVETIAEAEAGGIRWQLLSLEPDLDGNLIGTVRIANERDTALSGRTTLFANGLSVLSGGATTYLELGAHADEIWSFNTMYDSSQSLSGVGFPSGEFSFDFQEHLPLDRTLPRHGMDAVSALTFCADLDGEPACAAVLALPEAVALPEAEERLGMPEGRPLLEGPVRAELLGAAVGDKGIALSLECVNDTDADVRLRLSQAYVEDRYASFSYGCDSVLLPAHSTADIAALIDTNYVLEPGEQIHEIRFSLDAGQGPLEAKILLDAVYGTEEGVLLTADALGTIPARAE